MFKKVCDANEEDGGGISIHNIGGVFIVIFVGNISENYLLFKKFNFVKKICF